MPKKLLNNEPVEIVIIEKSWIEIPIIATPLTGTPIQIESYLIPPRVADYIELLEQSIKGPVPKLNPAPIEMAETTKQKN